MNLIIKRYKYEKYFCYSKKEHYHFKIISACSIIRFVNFNRQIEIWEIFKNTPSLLSFKPSFLKKQQRPNINYITIFNLTVERRFRLGLYYDETHLLTLMRQILCELSELHSEHLAHNNLTLNTLAYTPAGQKYKICDFSHTERLYS
jgi:serine/threonine protein kinase